MHRYCAFYCEENVWHLAGEAGFEDAWVVFVSNGSRQVPMYAQRAGAGDWVVWDYHVFLLQHGEVWDLDTTLGLPVGLTGYLTTSFAKLAALRPELVPLFRVVRASTFRRRFCSDRSHMRTADGGWTHPPPAGPTIAAGGKSNLMRWVDMNRPFLGEVVEMADLARNFS